MTVTVERGRADDVVEDGFAVRRAVFIDEQGVSEDVEMDGRDDEATHFVAYDGDHPVGTARLRVVEEGVGKVERVAVRGEYRERGVGRALMADVEAHAADRGLATLKLHAQTRVETFYRKLGYETTSGVFQEAGIDHVAMRKDLERGDPS
ncbi:MAG: GNAT family N-acetyltransferase [Haloarculaceae archaeon]